MNIKATTYQKLTNQQRMVATFEAMNRNDDQEVEKLLSSCPSKQYRVTDLVYIDSINRMLDLAMAFEYELLQLAFYTVVMVNDRKMFLQEMANIQHAWDIYLAEQNLTKEIVFNVAQLRNIIVSALMERLPEPQLESVNDYLILWKNSSPKK